MCRAAFGQSVWSEFISVSIFIVDRINFWLDKNDYKNKSPSRIALLRLVTVSNIRPMHFKPCTEHQTRRSKCIHIIQLSNELTSRCDFWTGVEHIDSRIFSTFSKRFWFRFESLIIVSSILWPLNGWIQTGQYFRGVIRLCIKTCVNFLKWRASDSKVFFSGKSTTVWNSNLKMPWADANALSKCQCIVLKVSLSHFLDIFDDFRQCHGERKNAFSLPA